MLGRFSLPSRLVLPAAGGVALAATVLGAAQPSLSRPSATSISGALNGISALSTSDAWAVGYDPAGSLILHWNGTTWSQATSPSPGSADATLNGVSMISPTDGWAVGSYLAAGPNGQFSFLILHWNGTKWTQTPAPAPGHGTLRAVSMVSAADGWAVGVQSSNQGGAAVALHWDGTHWTQVPVPNPGGVSDLYGVSAASASNAWAVGDGAVTSMAVHWNGTRWAKVSTPTPGTESSLAGVSDASPSDAWAVGMYGVSTEAKTLTLHWNGTTWRQVSAPGPGQGMPSSVPVNELAAVAVTSSSNVWSAGDYTVPSNAGQAAMTVRWNGTKWARVANPGGTVYSFLTGISMVSPSDGWAVGRNDGTRQVIILHWNGTKWTQASPGAIHGAAGRPAR